jgi:rSAM/selenodomain-associated transferase 1
MNAVHRVLDPSNPSDLPKGLCALAVMTKAPRAGKVKTRLTPPLTAEEAAELNICFLRDTTAAIASARSERGARGIAVYTPVGAEAAYHGILPDEFELVPQRGGAFGERLAFAIQDLLALGFDSACLIDSDSPTVPPRAYSEAVKFLSETDDALVLGPSDDGGYYLIGLKKLHRSLFEKIDWSTERVLEQTLACARAIDLEVHLLPAWYDVDDRATLHRLCHEFFTVNGSAPDAYPAPATRGYLDELLKREGRDRIWPNEQSEQ